MRLPDIKEKLDRLGVEAAAMSSAEFAAYVKNEIAKWKKVIDEAKIRRSDSGANGLPGQARQ